MGGLKVSRFRFKEGKGGSGERVLVLGARKCKSLSGSSLTVCMYLSQTITTRNLLKHVPLCINIIA